MAVSQVGSAAIVHGTVSAAPALPAGILAGQMLIIMVSSKHASDSIPTVNQGYTLLHSQLGGSGAFAVNTGNVRTSVFYKEATASETAPTVSNTGGNVVSARIWNYRKLGSRTWEIIGTGGSDNTGGTNNYLATSAINPGLKGGDIVLAFTTINTSAHVYGSTDNWITPGATTTAFTSLNKAGTTLGNDQYSLGSEIFVLNGASTGPISIDYVATTGTATADAPAGATTFVLLRETGPALISLVAIGVNSAGTVTSLTTTVPSEHVAEDMVIMLLAARPGTVGLTNVDTSWILAGSISGGVGTEGAGTGSAKIFFYYQISTGAAIPNDTVTFSGQSVTRGQVFIYRKQAGTTWDVGFTAGTFNTAASAAMSSTMNSALDLKPEDLLLANIFLNTAAYTYSAEDFTVPGADIGVADAFIKGSSTAGNDYYSLIDEIRVRSGQSTGPGVYTMTASGFTAGASPMGAIGIFRMRAVSANQVVNRSVSFAGATTLLASIVAKINFLRYSSGFDNATWLKQDVTVATGFTDPWGGTKAERLTSLAEFGSYIQQNLILPANLHNVRKDLALSVWVKANVATTFNLEMLGDGGVWGEVQNKAADTTWQRIFIKDSYFPSIPGEEADDIQVIISLPEGIGTVLYVAGAMLNPGAYPADYVETDDSTIVQRSVSFSATTTLQANLRGLAARSVSFAATSTLAANLRGIANRSVSFAATSTLQANLTGIASRAVTFQATSILSANLTGIAARSVTFQATSVLSATLTGTGNRAVNFGATSILQANLIGLAARAVNFAGNSTLTANLIGIAQRSVSFIGTGSMVADLKGTGNRAVNFAATSSLQATLTAIARGSVNFVGTGSLQATAGSNANRSVNFSATSSLQANLTGLAARAVTFVNTANLTADLKGNADRSVNFVASGSLSAEIRAIAERSVNFQAVAALSAEGISIAAREVAFIGAGSMIADLKGSAERSVNFVASSSMQAHLTDGSVYAQGLVFFTAKGSMAAAAIGLAARSVNFRAVSNLAATLRGTGAMQVSFLATGKLTADLRNFVEPFEKISLNSRFTRTLALNSRFTIILSLPSKLASRSLILDSPLADKVIHAKSSFTKILSNVSQF